MAFGHKKHSHGGLSVNSLHDLIEWGELHSGQYFSDTLLVVAAKTVDGPDKRGLKLCCLNDRWGFETLSRQSNEIELE